MLRIILLVPFLCGASIDAFIKNTIHLPSLKTIRNMERQDPLNGWLGFVNDFEFRYQYEDAENSEITIRYSPRFDTFPPTSKKLKSLLFERMLAIKLQERYALISNHIYYTGILDLQKRLVVLEKQKAKWLQQNLDSELDLHLTQVNIREYRNAILRTEININSNRQHLGNVDTRVAIIGVQAILDKLDRINKKRRSVDYRILQEALKQLELERKQSEERLVSFVEYSVNQDQEQSFEIGVKIPIGLKRDLGKVKLNRAYFRAVDRLVLEGNRNARSIANTSIELNLKATKYLADTSSYNHLQRIAEVYDRHGNVEIKQKLDAEIGLVKSQINLKASENDIRLLYISVLKDTSYLTQKPLVNYFSFR